MKKTPEGVTVEDFDCESGQSGIATLGKCRLFLGETTFAGHLWSGRDGPHILERNHLAQRKFILPPLLVLTGFWAPYPLAGFGVPPRQRRRNKRVGSKPEVTVSNRRQISGGSKALLRRCECYVPTSTTTWVDMTIDVLKIKSSSKQIKKRAMLSFLSLKRTKITLLQLACR